MNYKVIWRNLVRDISIVLGFMLVHALVVRVIQSASIMSDVVYAVLMLMAFTLAGCVGRRNISTRYLDLSIVGVGFWSVGLLNVMVFGLDATLIMLIKNAVVISLSVIVGVYLSLLLRPEPIAAMGVTH